MFVKCFAGRPVRASPYSHWPPDLQTAVSIPGLEQRLAFAYTTRSGRQPGSSSGYGRGFFLLAGAPVRGARGCSQPVCTEVRFAGVTEGRICSVSILSCTRS